MTNNNQFEVIIIGGSYSGLSAAMALGRASRKVLIIDSGEPCNQQTPHSHNFLTQDGKTPEEIKMLGRSQVELYDTITFFDGIATTGVKTGNGFEIKTSKGETFTARKLVFATGIKEIFPNIPGMAECWGITVLHCPYCHGYEIKHEQTGILGNGDYGFDFSRLTHNWTKQLTLFTNGPSSLTASQSEKLEKHSINIVEKEIQSLEHSNGQLQNVVFKDGTKFSLKALYTKNPFRQHCPIPEILGCELAEGGYIHIDTSQKTSVAGVFACGDNSSRTRSVSNSVATGTATGMSVNKELIEEDF